MISFLVDSKWSIVCGDNYIAERLEKVTAEIVDIVEKYKPDLFVAGPAYAAGRYGVACGSLCAAVNKKLKIPTVTAMNEINPGVDMYRKNVYILKTGTNARTISKDVAKMAEFAKKLVNKVELASPEVEGHFARGYKKNVVAEKKPPKCAVDMLLDKLRGKCAVNCPANAISLDKGKDHSKCHGFLLKTAEKFKPRYGCGKCQVAVPCECRIPKRI